MARHSVTPTSATTAGRKCAIFRSRIFHPATYSAGLSTSIPGEGRATRFVIPNPSSGKRTSSSCVKGSGVRPASQSSFQKRFDGPAK